MRQGGAPTLMAGLGDSQVVEVRLASGVSFSSDAICNIQRGQSVQLDVGEESKAITATIKVLREVLEKNGVIELPARANVVAYGFTWSVRLSESEWGPVWVKLGLERESLVSRWQARNVAV